MLPLASQDQLHLFVSFHQNILQNYLKQKYTKKMQHPWTINYLLEIAELTILSNSFLEVKEKRNVTIKKKEKFCGHIRKHIKFLWVIL